MYYENQENPIPKYKTILLIWSAFLISIVIYAGVTEYLVLSKDEAAPSASIICYLLLGLSIIEVLAIPYIKKYMSTLRLTPSETPDYEEVKLAKQQKFTTAHIVSFAISESVSLYGFAMAFSQQCDRTQFYIFFAISAFAMLLNFPSRLKWDSLDGTR